MMADRVVSRPAATDPEPDLAEAIRRISDGVQRLLRSGLNHRAIAVLLKDHTGVGMDAIFKVIDGLDTLAERYTVPVK